MKQLFKFFHKHLCLCIFLPCTIMLYGCKTTEKNKEENCPNSFFLVKKVKKQKNGVYIIYAHRNDSIFKIVSYYNGTKNGREKKLKRGMYFFVPTESVFGDFEKKNNLVPPCNAFMDFHGVAIGKEPEHDIDDVYFSSDLNGPYLTK